MNSAFIQLFLNTIRRESRSKTLIFMGVISITMIFLTHSLVKFVDKKLVESSLQMILGNQGFNITVVAINLWAIVLAILFGSKTIREDMSKGYLSLFLTFPISRFQYFLSRYLGSFALTCFFYLASLGLAIALLSKGSMTQIWEWHFLAGVGSTLLYLAGVLLLSILVSFFVSKSFSLVSTGLLMGVISLANAHVASGAAFEFSFWSLFSNLLHCIFPPFGKITTLSVNFFSYKSDTVIDYLGFFHFGGALVLLLGILLLFFRRKDF